MQKSSITARMSAFVRAYHTKRDGGTVFRDALAHPLLGQDYPAIADNLLAGAAYFTPDTVGSAQQVLDQIIYGCLGQTPLGRAAFAEQALETAVRIGARQYLLLGAGCDTFACRRPLWAQQLAVFEIDRPAAIADKQARLHTAGIEIPPHTWYVAADLAAEDGINTLRAHPAFAPDKISFCSLLGLVYYLPQTAFAHLLAALAELLPAGSSLVFDYPLPMDETGAKLSRLAAGAGERMQAVYTSRQMENLLAENGWLIYEHLTPQMIEERFFAAHNAVYPMRQMTAPADVRYCLAVRGR